MSINGISDMTETAASVLVKKIVNNLDKHWKQQLSFGKAIAIVEITMFEERRVTVCLNDITKTADFRNRDGIVHDVIVPKQNA